MQRIDDIGGKAFVKQKSEKIVQPSEEVIKRQLKELVRGSVEETLNELLEQEAEKLPYDNAVAEATYSIQGGVRGWQLLQLAEGAGAHPQRLCALVQQRAHPRLFGLPVAGCLLSISKSTCPINFGTKKG